MGLAWPSYDVLRRLGLASPGLGWPGQRYKLEQLSPNRPSVSSQGGLAERPKKGEVLWNPVTSRGQGKRERGRGRRRIDTEKEDEGKRRHERTRGGVRSIIWGIIPHVLLPYGVLRA